MSLANRPSATVPPLVAGEHLDRATFHERYEQMPTGTRAELIGGVVYMPPPVGPEHGDWNTPAVLWLALYEAATPGVRVSVNASTALDDLGEPQPDVSLRILPEYGGQTRSEPGYLVGPPQLVVEVARTSRELDLGSKKEDYRRAGVSEYIVMALEPNELFWFVRRGSRFIALKPDQDGIYRSRIFPGLWLDVEGLWRRDLNRLRTALEAGLASPEHADLVARLAESKRRLEAGSESGQGSGG